MLVAAAAATFPDTDWVLSLYSPLLYLTQHRGVTHSLLMLPLWALALAWVCARFSRRHREIRPWVEPLALGIAIHIVGDWITSFGTMLLAPFSNRRFALDATFVIDLWFTGIIVAGLLLSLAWRRSRRPAQAALAVLGAYVGLQVLAHHEALKVGRELAAASGWHEARVTAWPRPVSPFNWTLVAELDDRYEAAHVNLVRKTPLSASPGDGFIRRLDAPYLPASAATWSSSHPKFGSDAPTIALARTAWSDPEFAFFRWFSELPALYRVEPAKPARATPVSSRLSADARCVFFFDLRFLSPGRDTIPFRYGICGAGTGFSTRWLLDGDSGRMPVP